MKSARKENHVAIEQSILWPTNRQCSRVSAFGWTAFRPTANAPHVGVFPTSQPYVDIFTITETGSASVFKLGNTALRTLDGGCFLNGQATTPEEEYYVPDNNGN